MKKVSIVATIMLLIALTFSSCKSVQDCPAYGQGSQADTEEVRA